MTSAPEQVSASRRQVLCGLAVALLAPGALAACGDGDSTGAGPGSTAPRANPPNTKPTTAAPGTPGAGGPANALAKVADVPIGGGTIVDGPDGRKLLLVQPSAGTVKAYDPTCPHQGTQVDPPEDGTITCPNHGSQFSDTDGSVQKGPARSALTEVQVRVAGDSVVPA